MIKRGILILFIILSYLNQLQAQNTEDQIEKWGKFDQWVVREIKESGIIGGHSKFLYEIAPNATIKGAIPYVNPQGCVWSTSNVLAIVMKITKGSNTVFPEKRGDGYCARLETRVEKVKVLGMIDLNVLASGTIFLGNMHEPITDTKDPQSKLNIGVKYTSRPSALTFDYKATIGNSRIKASGMGHPKTLGDNDYAECVVMLQRRWEDAQGNIYAKRVGTGFTRITKSTSDWVNNYSMPIYYGDITTKPYYKSYMKLIPKELSNYAINSKGVSVPILEVGWASENEMPTHIIIRFSSSYGEAYIGDPANRLWIDNVKIIQ